MDILCFTPEEQTSIYRVLSSVLHLGNVYFQPHQVLVVTSTHLLLDRKRLSSLCDNQRIMLMILIDKNEGLCLCGCGYRLRVRRWHLL